MSHTIDYEDDREDNLDEERHDVWWRAEESTRYSQYGLPRTHIQVQRYEKEQETPCGCWVVRKPARTKSVLGRYVPGLVRSWIHKDGSRKFSKTKRGALESLWYRKQSHVYHANLRLQKAQNAFEAVSKVLDKEPLTKAQQQEKRVKEYFLGL